jgi:hypothetical protein
VGIGTAAVFAAAYALKDRLKELSRIWLAGRLQRMYGQRAMQLRLPKRIDPSRFVLVSAREHCETRAEEGDDVLNQSVGRTRRLVVLHYRMNAVAHASPLLRRSGLHSVKHIFRYDLTPLFSRLDNAVKRVPVLDEHQRVHFADAPKEYRFPVRLDACADGKRTRFVGELVVSKRGIERVEESLADE